MQGVVQSWDEAVHGCVANLPEDHLWAVRYAKATTDQGRQRIAEAVYFFATGVAGPTVRGPTADIGARINVGETLTSLFPDLTKAEAAAFVSQEAFATSRDWLWDKATRDHPELKSAAKPSEVAVIRWLLCILTESSTKRRKALFRSRRNSFGEEGFEGNALQRLDEIQTEDLCESVNATLSRAVARAFKEKWGGPNELVPSPSWEKHLPEGVRLLRKASDLYQEGREMRHCAFTYCGKVQNKEVLLFSLRVDGARATALTAPHGGIEQLVGFANGQPAPETRKLAERIRFIISRPDV